VIFIHRTQEIAYNSLMGLLTTTIGSYPKPDYVPIADWFRSPEAMRMQEVAGNPGSSLDVRKIEDLLVRGTKEVVLDQVNAGIDVPTDGEVRRENYIYYHCRHLAGIDFGDYTKKVIRSGAGEAKVPTIHDKIKPRSLFLSNDWRIAQSFTKKPVKMTLPGPLTIADTLADAYYHDERRLCADIAEALHTEIRALAAAGCSWIQIDEPLFAREPEKALAFGVENIERCFQGLPASVTKILHICCGYPTKLDEEGYPKADPSSYFVLADALEASSIDAVSIEDAHRHNDLSLLERFVKTKIILGVVAVAKSRVEQTEEIQARLNAALAHIDASRLIAAPDCGLGMLSRSTALAKLENLSKAAHSF